MAKQSKEINKLAAAGGLAYSDFTETTYSPVQRVNTQSLPGRIAVVGDKNTIQIFKVLGLDVFYHTNSYNIRDTIKNLAAKQYSIILITEREAESVQDYIDTFRGLPYPIILTIPDGVNNLNTGINKINHNIEVATGQTAKQLTGEG